jgi:rod shape-determining protein MreC
MDNLMGRYRNVTFLAAAIFIQILGLAMQVKRATENQSSRLIRVWAVTAVTPLEKGIVRLQTGSSELWHNYFYLRGVRQENRDLRQQIEQLQLEQVRLKQDADQARRLQALLGFKEQYIAKTTAAQVIGSSGSEQSRIVYLDKGSRDGIEQGMPVISADGVVGKVLTVFKATSTVLLINDQQSGVGAILEQSRLQGVLKGKVTGELVIDKIMPDEQVKPGDRVLTSGGDQIFPKGLPLGTVARTTKSEFLQLTVKPAAVLSHLEEVLVIMKKEEHGSDASASAPVRAADILSQRLPSVPDKPAEPVATGGGSAAKPAATERAVSTTPGAAASPTKPPVTSPQAAPSNKAGNSAVTSATPVPKPAVKTTSTPLVAKPVSDKITPPPTGDSPQ